MSRDQRTEQSYSEPVRFTATWGDAVNGEPSGEPLPVREDHITDADLLAMSSTVDGRKKSYPLSEHDERVARACCEALLHGGRRSMSLSDSQQKQRVDAAWKVVGATEHYPNLRDQIVEALAAADRAVPMVPVEDVAINELVHSKRHAQNERNFALVKRLALAISHHRADIIEAGDVKVLPGYEEAAQAKHRADVRLWGALDE